MATGRFNIKGTKDFLVAAVFCGFLCLWSIRDAWFPTKKILEKHPQEVPVSFKVPGVVKNIPVTPGAEVGGRTVLAELHDEPYKAKVVEATAAFEAAKAARAADVDEKLAFLSKAKADLEACTLVNTDFTMKTSHGEEPLRGTVLQIAVRPASHVDAGQPVLTVAPTDTFYMFNKTLAVLSFIGAAVFLVFHRIASK